MALILKESTLVRRNESICLLVNDLRMLSTFTRTMKWASTLKLYDVCFVTNIYLRK